MEAAVAAASALAAAAALAVAPAAVALAAAALVVLVVVPVAAASVLNVAAVLAMVPAEAAILVVLPVIDNKTGPVQQERVPRPHPEMACPAEEPLAAQRLSRKSPAALEQARHGPVRQEQGGRPLLNLALLKEGLPPSVQIRLAVPTMTAGQLDHRPARQLPHPHDLRGIRLRIEESANVLPGLAQGQLPA